MFFKFSSNRTATLILGLALAQAAQTTTRLLEDPTQNSNSTETTDFQSYAESLSLE